MQIEFRHPLPADPQTAWDEMFGEAYSNAVNQDSGARFDVISDEQIDGKRVRRVRVTGNKPLPTFAQKALGSETFTYDQIETYEDGAPRLHWSVETPLGDKLQAQGVYEIVADSNGSTRIVRGEIRVAIPVFGSKIERAIADQLEKSYDRTAAFAKTWLEKHA